MKSVQKPIVTRISAAVVAVLAASAAQAGSFSLYTETSAVALGNYAAGIAAEAADASTGWYNPAGLALIHNQQVVMSGAGVFPRSTVTGTSTFVTPANPPLAAPPAFTESYTDLNGARSAFIPAFHYARPIGDNAAVGLSVTSPFGLSTDWDRNGPLRYAATYSELLTTDISPEIGGKVSENFALGAGLDIQYARVKFNRMLGLPTVMPVIGLAPSAVDSYSYNIGDSWGVGFHAGILGMFNENHTRIGLNYQSKMKQKFHGWSQLTGKLSNPGLIIVSPASVNAANPNAKTWSNNLSSNSIEFPDVVTLSGYHDLNERFALLGSVVYTGWSSLKTIQLNNVAAASAAGPAFPASVQFNPTPLNSGSEQNYKNVWRFAVGGNYKLNDQWLLRAGGGYDQTPTNDANRDIRIADNDRWALSIGTHYQARPNIGFDLGYTHLFSAGSEPINRTEVQGTSTSTYNVNAMAKGTADLVAAQVVWNMDEPLLAVSKK